MSRHKSPTCGVKKVGFLVKTSEFFYKRQARALSPWAIFILITSEVLQRPRTVHCVRCSTAGHLCARRYEKSNDQSNDYYAVTQESLPLLLKRLRRYYEFFLLLFLFFKCASIKKIASRSRQPIIIRRHPSTAIIFFGEINEVHTWSKLLQIYSSPTDKTRGRMSLSMRQHETVVGPESCRYLYR